MVQDDPPKPELRPLEQAHYPEVNGPDKPLPPPGKKESLLWPGFIAIIVVGVWYYIWRIAGLGGLVSVYAPMTRQRRGYGNGGAFDMFATIFGAAMVVSASLFFWYLLPRNGQENPLVKNSNVGSMVTIAILGIITIGIAILCEGLFG